MTRAKESDSAQKMAIVGSGPSGLLSAYYAVQQGQPASSITVYEASGRTGGHAGGKAANYGPEFIDSRHKRLRAVARELGVELELSTDQSRMAFQRPNGKRMSQEEFAAAYKPLADIIREDKQRAKSDPDFAREMDGQSLDKYIASVAARAEKQRISQRTYTGYFNEMMPWSPRKGLDPDIAKIVTEAYASEVGRPASAVSGMSFLREASTECDANGLPVALMESDCAYRVKGGMETLYARMREKLEDGGKGVRFETGARATGISRDGAATKLTFEDGRTEEAGRVVLAVPAHALGGIQGLEALGMQPEILAQASKLQYTKSAKITVKLKEGVEIPPENYYSNSGFQAWQRPGEGSITFLVGGDMLEGKKGKALQAAVLREYAASLGKSPAELFDVNESSIVTNAPGQDNACYASPGVGQSLSLDNIRLANARLATQGVALVGSYIPTESGGVGFMENAAEAAFTAQQTLVQQARELSAIRAQQKAAQRSGGSPLAV